ncbi:5-methylcytosine restriction system specificity protein McrC [Gemelliphila palaticanis]|uniref:Guanosine 5'-monophosphate oxidoreductase n=1 Tax=Gemelliphila palaticanis TaxID=81950 RepID=A0ABX2T0G4_9BACL|nr:guanosine 5'-monophosphate oxidoreductase [Gemella palaticanis]MBF0714760.1 guanosine 5'-monophosphate oxidoreductase [Gemella palaticanis]NYS46690.1 guanosine 5'-monophosphate oxidoreductase [Gemella palaticanis]
MIYLKDNSDISQYKSKIIEEFKNKDLKTLLEENKNLILFPGEESRKINEESYIFQEIDGKTWTRNIVGFLSSEYITNDSTELASEEIIIGSRFSHTDDKKLDNLNEDNFLMYMLNKVMNYNITSRNFSFSSNKNSLLDIYAYLFPNQLEKAIKQGYYKEYVTKKYNDMNVRGSIDVQRFIKNNIPFTGNISYNTREFSYDNNITQLIRHTIEFIQQKYPGLFNVSENVKDSVKKIVQLTPSYNKLDRQKIISENVKNKLNKAYFSEYIKLQDLCLKIFKQEKITYSTQKTKNKISGLIIDVAWLWEEYIGVITKANLNKNNDFKDNTWYKYVYRKNPLYLFENNKGPRYPDFTYGTIPIDTKYKINIDERNDYNQMVTYMFMLKSEKGGFLKPIKKGLEEKGYDSIGNLVCYHEEVCKQGEMFIYKFEIPDSSTYEQFIEDISKEEEGLFNFSWK